MLHDDKGHRGLRKQLWRGLHKDVIGTPEPAAWRCCWGSPRANWRRLGESVRRTGITVNGMPQSAQNLKYAPFEIRTGGKLQGAEQGKRIRLGGHVWRGPVVEVKGFKK